MVNWSISHLPEPAMVIVSDEDVNAVLVTLVISLDAVKLRVGLTAELNCHPVGVASTKIIVHEPGLKPMSNITPSVTVIVPNVVQCGALPVAA